MITAHPSGGNVALQNNITFACKATGQGSLLFTWELHGNTSDWHVADVTNATSYTVTAEASGKFMYRCKVANEAGSVTSDEASINVFGKYFIIG